jgi:hypothetical protein
MKGELRVTEKDTIRKMLAKIMRSNLLMIAMTLHSGKGRKSESLLVDKCLLDLGLVVVVLCMSEALKS